MSTVADSLPLTETLEPGDQPALVAAVRAAHEAGTAVYPIGGGTSLDYGVLPKRPGIGLSLAGLNRVIDYPARDLTITVEAGISLARLAETLAAERQRLPLDVPQVERATLGGLIATNFSGPLRYSQGTVRDYVIGISAVDGRGTPFKGGGRVVKNVAGYDFCKLLVGSLGTIGVVTQVTLKVKPIPDRTALVACPVRDLAHAEHLLAALVTSRAVPAAIELFSGPEWRDDPALGQITSGQFAHLLVALEGTVAEVDWMTTALADEWQALGAAARTIPVAEADGLWQRLREFPVGPAALTLKISVPPSRMLELIRLATEAEPDVSWQAHAGNGVVLLRFASFPKGGLSRLLLGRVQPAAQLAGGSVVILSCSQPGELTRQAIWGIVPNAAMLMEAVKRQFDPKDILNPGRFVYPTQ